jgi:hypothetical protein
MTCPYTRSPVVRFVPAEAFGPAETHVWDEAAMDRVREAVEALGPAPVDVETSAHDDRTRKGPNLS